LRPSPCLRPQFGSACYRRALFYVNLANMMRHRILEKLLDDEEFCDIAGYFKGVALKNLGRYEEALEYVDGYITKYPGYREPYLEKLIF